MVASLRTDRLVLRRWRGADRDRFAELNADPVVMEFFPSVLTRAESDAFVDGIEACFEANDFGLWAVEVVDRAQHSGFIGFVGLSAATFDASFTPAVEVGWRLARAHWGSGYAGEAARAAVADGFERLGLAEIVSFTATTNLRSRRVMERLGMTHDPAENFEHPKVAVGHPLRTHVLYRLGRS